MKYAVVADLYCSLKWYKILFMVTKWLINNYVIQYASQVHVIFCSTEITSVPIVAISQCYLVYFYILQI